MQTQRAGGTYTGVQALRFVAALLVVMTHATLYTSERLDDSLPVWHFGEVGVDIFFVISGFVMMISTQRLVGRRDGWKYFWMRRCIRIVPMYWIATTIKLLALVVAPAAVLHATLDPQQIVLSYLFLPSRDVDGLVQPLLGVGWTLTFEMFFYFVFGLALLLRANRLLFAGSVLLAVATGWLARDNPFPPAQVYFDPIVLYFLIGMVIGKWTLDRSTVRCVGALAAVLGYRTLLLAINAGGLGHLAFRDVAKPTAVTLLVLAAVMLDPVLQGRIPRPITFLGDASYSLYLFHPLTAPAVPAVLSAIGLTSVPLSLVLCVVVAVVAASLIYRYVESPLTVALQARLPYVRPSAPSGVTAVAP